MHCLLSSAGTPEEETRLRDELTGPLRAQGDLPPEDRDAPAWWHGDDAAVRDFLAAVGATLPTGGTGVRR